MKVAEVAKMLRRTGGHPTKLAEIEIAPGLDLNEQRDVGLSGEDIGTYLLPIGQSDRHADPMHEVTAVRKTRRPSWLREAPCQNYVQEIQVA